MTITGEVMFLPVSVCPVRFVVWPMCPSDFHKTLYDYGLLVCKKTFNFGVLPY